MKARISKVKRALSNSKKFGAILITKPQNIQYVTGYQGHDAWLLATPKKLYLITDGRYTEEAGAFFRTISSVEVVIISLAVSRFDVIKNVLKKQRLRSLAIEAMDLVYGIAKHLELMIAPKKVIPVNSFIETMRMVKDDEEIQAIRRAVRLDEKVFRLLMTKARPGISEMSLVNFAEAKMKAFGGDGPSYPTIVAASKKAALPHAVSGKEKIKNNDMLLIDMGTSFKGYVSDLTRTFFFGRMSDLFKERYQLVLEAQQLAISRIRPGIKIGQLERAVRAFFLKRGFEKEFCHSLGHGIGLEIHELPWVNSKSETMIKKNMVITIEPGLYFPGWGGIRIEDDVLVTKNGCEVLSKYPKKLANAVLN